MKSSEKVNMENFCLNFSNPQLAKPKWHRNIHPKAVNKYIWGTPCIQRLLFPEWSNYEINTSNEYKPKLNFDSHHKSSESKSIDDMHKYGREKKSFIINKNRNEKLLESVGGNSLNKRINSELSSYKIPRKPKDLNNITEILHRKEVPNKSRMQFLTPNRRGYFKLNPEQM